MGYSDTGSPYNEAQSILSTYFTDKLLWAHASAEEYQNVISAFNIEKHVNQATQLDNNVHA